MNRLLESLKIPNLPIDIDELKKKSLILVSKLIRTKNIDDDFHAQKLQKSSSSKQKLTKCLTTLDLTSLGVGSCAGTGMYLVAGMVARNVAGPGVIFSFIIAALASIFSGACYAEFGVRVPHTTGSAYMYSYVTVGEFLAFVIGWNMILEYLIGTSACACALSACFDAISNGGVSGFSERNFGSIFGRPPDLLAFVIALLMMILLVAGVKKSLIFNNILNAINFSIWVFVMTAGLFYVDFDNWTKHGGFLPYGWSGVLTGAATCFYAFIGFDIIATTGEEATNPKKSIPLAIVGSLAIILIAYVTSSLMLTLIVPYNEIDEDSALVEMFGQVNATYCKYIVVIGALAGLTVSMFGSMFPMPRIIYAMAQDGLIFKLLAEVWSTTGTPALATLISGFAAAVAALFIKLEILVEMMSIGTLLAYTLVSTCVLILRYQPRTTNLVELLPQSLRAHLLASGADGGDPLSTPLPQDVLKQFLDANLPPIPPPTSPLPQQPNTQRVMIRRITRSSPDSDDTYSDDNDAFTQRDDQVLVSERTENKSYGTVEDKPSFTSSGIIGSTIGPSLSYLSRRFNEAKYLCPGIFPWTDHGPPTEESGMFVMKMVGYLYVLVIIFDIIVVCEMHYMGATAITFLCIFLFAIICILLAISRKPQNRHNMLFITPGLPFVPALAITINIYLILKLSILTLVRFTIWMTLGFIMYFYYGIKNSLLEDPNAQQKVEENHPEKSTTVSESADNALSSQYKSTKSNPFIKSSPKTEVAQPQDTWTGSVFKDEPAQSEKNGVNPLFVPETHFPSWDD